MKPLLLVLLLVGCTQGGGNATTSTGLALSDLSGRWENDQVVLRVNDAGEYLVLLPGEGDEEEPIMVGFVAREDGVFSFVTGLGGECPGLTGVYEASRDEGSLTLDQVEDPCQERVSWFESTFSGPAG